MRDDGASVVDDNFEVLIAALDRLSGYIGDTQFWEARFTPA